MDDLQRWLSQLGFNFDPILDGKFKRFVPTGRKNKDGWYVGSTYTTKSGKSGSCITIEDFSTGERWHFPEKKNGHSDTDYAEIRAEQERLKIKTEEEREKENEQCRIESQKIWDEAKEESHHPYLSSKKISPLGTRVRDKALLVPVRDGAGNLNGLQRIFADGSKFFIPGTKKKGSFFTINGTGEQPRKTIAIVEGFATGASIHMVTGWTVIVCFDVGNLYNVCKSIEDKSNLVVCADNDKFSALNAGLEAAQKINKEFGIPYLLPVFKDESSKPSDFNDLYCLESAAELLKQLKPQPKEIRSEEKTPDYKDKLLCLGHFDDSYFYTSTSNAQIRKLAIPNHTELYFVDLMPEGWWKERHPQKKKDADGNYFISGVNWKQAAHTVMSKGREIGIFNPDKIRGLGCWLENGKPIFHLGDSLWKDGRLSSLESNDGYIYPLDKSISRPTAVLSKEDGQRLIDVISLCCWKKNYYPILVAGWLFASKLGSALPWRPHLYIAGEKGSGKSAFFQRLIKKVLGPDQAIYCASTSTEAALRQKLKSSCLPIVFDELDKSDDRGDRAKHDGERIQGIITLARHASSEFDAKIIKGGQKNAVEYTVRSCFVCGSIKIPLISDADKSRFAIVELEKNKQDLAKWEEFLKAVENLGDDLFQRFLARVLNSYDVFCANYKIAQRMLATKFNDQRFGQLYGSIFAGYASLIKDRPMQEEEFALLMEAINLQEELEESADTNVEDLYWFILNKKLSIVDKVAGRIDSNILSLSLKKDDETLSLLGIKSGISHGKECIFIQEKHPEFDALLRGSRWESGWRRTLIKIQGSSRTSNKWNGIKKNCIAIPLPIISKEEQQAQMDSFFEDQAELSNQLVQNI